MALKRILEGLEDLECRTCDWLVVLAKKRRRFSPNWVFY
jgi:hypothetical protein